MKKKLNKIIYSFSVMFLLSSCHNLEHQNIFFKILKKEVVYNIIDEEKINISDKSEANESKKNLNKSNMAPILIPEQKEKVKKYTLNRKVITPKKKSFNINSFKNWTENRLIQKMGKSNFIKEEGKLKNYQYYFKKCFLDVFLIKQKNDYFITYVETRPTKLYGNVKIDDCLKEIVKSLN